MRELNQFNKTVLQMFSSRQAYTFINGQYVPIIMNNVSDESVMEVDKRKYYIQNYDFTMLGYLIDEQEFEVKPAISRVLQVFEIDESRPKRRPKREPENQNRFELNFVFEVNDFFLSKTFEYNVDISVIRSENISSYNIYINDDFFGTDLQSFSLQTNDVFSIEIEKPFITETSSILLECKLV
jgi:hypothetical protein